jgi:cyclophilin family peptidyl-prolyl cis-trans isomerase
MNCCSNIVRYWVISRGTAAIRLAVVLWLSVASQISLVNADAESALQAMENPDNPLIQLDTARGDIFVELLPDEAPNNVRRILGLVRGELEIEDPVNGFSFQPRYYDGMRFHRVIPGFVIQTGAAVNHPLGDPGEPLADEINADSLGLDQQPVMHEDGSFNDLLGVANRQVFEEQVLAPLYADLAITSPQVLENRQYQVLDRLQSLTVKALYQLQGYRYQNSYQTRPIQRGIVALANRGPNSNSGEFFIALDDEPTLTGKYTVIGQVVEGMAVADAIGNSAVDPQRYSRLSTVIYSARQVNAGTTPVAPIDSQPAR